MNRLILCGVLAVAFLSGCGGPSHQERLSLAISELQQGRLDSAASQFRAIVENYPGDAQSYYYLGMINQAEGKPEMAIYYYQCALTADPGFRAARDAMNRAKDTTHVGPQLIFHPNPGSLPTD